MNKNSTSLVCLVDILQGRATISNPNEEFAADMNCAMFAKELSELQCQYFMNEQYKSLRRFFDKVLTLSQKY